jgi:hypothetical protein
LSSNDFFFRQVATSNQNLWRWWWVGGVVLVDGQAIEYHSCPQPGLKISIKPMLWCVLKKYSDYEIRDFIICNGCHGLGIKV